MSNYTATHQYLDYDDIEICDYCGCEYRVRSFKQDGHNETEEYHCPKCGKTYKIRACNTPYVTLIKERTDGQEDNCSDNYKKEDDGNE